MTDPRDQKNQHYSLESLLLIIFASTISGYDPLDGTVEFAQLKLNWLNKYVDLKRVPCAETLRYFLACLSVDELIRGYQAFIQSDPTKDVIAIDGKTMRGTARNGRDALYVLSAWSADQGISLGALASEGKSNEIKTIPKLLDTINIQGAMGCQRSIAAKIRERQGDYALQVKANPCGRVVIQRLDIKTEGVSISRDQSTSEFRMLRGWCPAYSGRNSVLGSSWELQEPVITMLREKCKSQGTPQGGVISPSWRTYSCTMFSTSGCRNIIHS
ncbi:MAG: ISAs1 family transposase [Reinekea sp.]